MFRPPHVVIISPSPLISFPLTYASSSSPASTVITLYFTMYGRQAWHGSRQAGSNDQTSGDRAGDHLQRCHAMIEKCAKNEKCTKDCRRYCQAMPARPGLPAMPARLQAPTTPRGPCPPCTVQNPTGTGFIQQAERKDYEKEDVYIIARLSGHARLRNGVPPPLARLQLSTAAPQKDAIVRSVRSFRHVEPCRREVTPDFLTRNIPFRR